MTKGGGYGSGYAVLDMGALQKEGDTEVDHKAIAEALSRTQRRIKVSAEAEGLDLAMVSLSSTPAVRTVEALTQILDALMPVLRDRCGNNWDEKAAFARMLLELENSTTNEATIYTFSKGAWELQVSSFLKSSDGGTLKALLSLPCEERQRMVEQWGSLQGHPSHPMARMRVWDESAIALSDLEIKSWCPEFQPIVRIPVLALRKSSANVAISKYQESVDACKYFAIAFSKAYDQWESALLSAGLLPSEYLPLPCHVANLDRLRERFQDLVDDKSLILPNIIATEDCSWPTISTTPMMSFRTMLPLPQESTMPSPPYIKLPVPIRLTSLVRYVSPVEAHGGPILSDLVLTLLPQTGIATLALVPEEIGIHLDDPRHSYEESRYVSCLFRQNTNTLLTPGHVHVPIAALLHPLKEGTLPLISELACASAGGIADFFKQYATVVVNAALGFYLRTGITLELHQQNTLVEFKGDGRSSRLICREVAGGIYCFETTLKARGHDLRQHLHPRQDSIYEEVAIPFATLWHSSFLMHLFPIARALCECNGAAFDWNSALNEIRNLVLQEVALVRSEIQQMQDSTMREALAAHVDQTENVLVFSPTLPFKSLLLMRALGTKCETFTDRPNPFWRDADQ